jgi:hypothetical protein
MGNFYFDYEKFYNYYSDVSNLETNNEKLNPDIYYYSETPNNIQIPIQTTLSDKFITINNTRIFVSSIGKQRLLFTIPTLIDNKWWDFHYHFGKRIINKPKRKSQKRKKPIDGVFFHKTIQKPTENGKENINCYFRQKMNIDLNNFEDMECLQRGNKMRELYTPEDFVFIKEIISRPFLNQTAGKSRKTRRKNKRINHRKSIRY